MQPFVADDAGKSEMPVRGEQGTSGGAQSEGGPYSPPGEPPQRRDVNTILTVFADRRRRDSRRRLIFRVLVFLNLSASDRNSVVSGKSVSVRLELRGCRLMQKKKTIRNQHHT